MTARLARLALALYPLAYRRRYGDEMEALLEDSGTSPGALADLLRGAVSAHLRPEPSIAASVGGEDRVRLGISSVLLCWVLFALAGLALYKTTETRSLEGTAAPGLLGGIHLAIQILAAIVSLAAVVGAAPLILAALGQIADLDGPRQIGSGARRHGGSPAEVRRAARLAVAYVATFVVATAALVVVANADSGLSAGVGALVLAVWSLIALACGIGCALAARRGLFATQVSPRALALARACATVVAATMVGIAALVAVYLVDLEATAPGLAGTGNGPLGVPNVALSLSLSLVLLAMVALAVPAALSATRTWRRPAGG